MSQISEISAFAYTREMETLRALPDILTFDGESVPVSRSLLTPGTRSLQLLSLPGTEFLVRYEMSYMRGFQSELGLIGLKDFGLATYSARFDRLCRLQSILEKASSRLSLIGPKDVDFTLISEISAFAYTREMETLRALPDILTFDGESVPVSRSLLTPGTRSLQLLSLPGTEFLVRYEMSYMRGFQSELSDAAVEWRGAGAEVRDATVLQGAQLGSSCVTQLCRHVTRPCSCVTQLRFKPKLGLIWARPARVDQPLMPPLSGTCWTLRARVIAAGFGDYAAGLRRTQPRFAPAMRYALMERWNDCTHTFVFGFNEMTLTPVDYAAITGLRFTGPAPPLDSRYQTATLGAQLVRSLLGVTTQTTQGCMSYEMVFRFWAERIRTRLEAWRELPEEAQNTTPAYTQEERDRAARSFLFYIISSQLPCTSKNKGDPVVLACLRDLS
ncbi:hypothetical protein JCGZ_22936 [Jatropha curcas]|uniref:Aminotransferase-like plant mobile domain-containing protein n=1 Tax=Jatropha curcas TaxID=180498 RepID=A0A067JQ38_JATCU|nr:hypothetical protein JCGZ_22936 [Jatropha curcas]